MWQQVSKLQGKEINRATEVKVYSDNKQIIEGDEAAKQMMDFWTGIYRKSENTIGDEWNEIEAEQYLVRVKETDQKAQINFHDCLIDRVMGRSQNRSQVFSRNMIEHMEMLDGVINDERMAVPMREIA
jgi:hypothetical protein